MLKQFFMRTSPFKLSPAWTIFSYTLLIFWTVVTLLPFYWLVVTTFKLPIDVSTGPKYLPWVDFEPDTHAFDEMLFSDAAGNLVTTPYLNTITIAVSSSAIALLIGSMSAYALTRFDYRPKPGLIVTFALSIAFGTYLYSRGLPAIASGVFALCVYLLVAQTIGRRFKGSLENSDIAFWLVSQRMLPPIAVIVPIYIMYNYLGLLDKRLGIIIAYTAVNLPLVIWFMRDYFQAIPVELEESAFIDGASRYQVLWHIVLPLAVPGLIATGIIVLIFAWNEYTLAVFLSRGQNTQTMPILVAAQNATRGPQWWTISLLVLMMVAPIVLMSAVLERFIARGLLLGAVKG